MIVASDECTHHVDVQMLAAEVGKAQSKLSEVMQSVLAPFQSADKEQVGQTGWPVCCGSRVWLPAAAVVMMRSAVHATSCQQIAHCLLQLLLCATTSCLFMVAYLI